MIRSRIAPTPSGYLHLGNAVNFLITWLMVRHGGGTLKLRIDDGDLGRCRPAFIDDIFVQLDWLGITWDEGPSGPDDFLARFSQRLRQERYRDLLQALRDRARLFPCSCSRKEIEASSKGGLYPGTCRALPLVGIGTRAVRVHVPEATLVEVDGVEVALGREMGDFVLWRRDGLASYQLASLADDLDDGINLIVRGSDLLASSAAQLFLARQLGAAGFLAATFHHHPLITCRQGKKLSKSDGALSLKALRGTAMASPLSVYQAAARQLGLDEAAAGTLDELLAQFRLTRART